MKFRKLLFLLSLMFLSCNKEEPKYKVCEYATDDPLLQAYNDLLIELVENHFYNLYLGEEQEALLQDWYKIENPNSADFAPFEERLIQLQNSLFGDSARIKTIYIANQARFAARFSELLPDKLSDLSDEFGSVSGFLRKYGVDLENALLHLSKTIEKYRANDYQACTFKADTLGEDKSWFDLSAIKKQKAIGQVAFSEIYWIDKDTGLLYYEFQCGGKCGKGELLSFEKVNGRWRILEKYQLWIS
ncbi:hypothetical protein ACMA1I_00395 [Pontibacter sp. 13R65]|uniref:hypothetical protein n=1 Tax=Pontibacter sp. 13R65 TaxID=3127458 RepID=UPI00301D37EF